VVYSARLHDEIDSSENKLEQNDFLFKSSVGNLPISRQQTYRIINSVAKEVGIDVKIGTNTFR